MALAELRDARHCSLAYDVDDLRVSNPNDSGAWKALASDCATTTRATHKSSHPKVLVHEARLSTGKRQVKPNWGRRLTEHEGEATPVSPALDELEKAILALIPEMRRNCPVPGRTPAARFVPSSALVNALLKASVVKPSDIVPEGNGFALPEPFRLSGGAAINSHVEDWTLAFFAELAARAAHLQRDEVRLSRGMRFESVIAHEIVIDWGLDPYEAENVLTQLWHDLSDLIVQEGELQGTWGTVTFDAIGLLLRVNRAAFPGESSPWVVEDGSWERTDFT